MSLFSEIYNRGYNQISKLISNNSFYQLFKNKINKEYSLVRIETIQATKMKIGRETIVNVFLRGKNYKVTFKSGNIKCTCNRPRRLGCPCIHALIANKKFKIVKTYKIPDHLNPKKFQNDFGDLQISQMDLSLIKYIPNCVIPSKVHKLFKQNINRKLSVVEIQRMLAKAKRK